MGELIVLAQRRADRSQPRGESRSAFFFDLACPFSYLAAERVERLLGQVDWVPAARLGPRRDDARARARAEQRASELRLPLSWPDRFPADTPGAMRASASQHGYRSKFALAAARLAFCGGFDLEDPEVLADAAAAAGVRIDECLAAASDATLDAKLEATSRKLVAQGVRELPAVLVRRGLFAGEWRLEEAAALLSSVRRDEPGEDPAVQRRLPILGMRLGANVRRLDDDSRNVLKVG